MKRPVTSLCRRPGKKDRLRGSLSPVREQFPPIETLCGGQAELLGKSRPNEGSKTVPGEAGGCVQAAPMGEGRQWEVSGSGKHRTGLPARTEGIPGAKTAPGGGRELCADCAHGRAADIMCGVVSGRHRTGHPPGQRARPAQKQPRREPEAVWMRDMGVTCPGRSV